MPRASVRLDASPRPDEALAWALEEPRAALALMVTRAEGSAVRVAERPGARARLEEAARAAHEAGASSALAWQAVGLVPEGGVMTIVASSGPSRRSAQAGLDALVAGLKGVVAREDAPAPG